MNEGAPEPAALDEIILHGHRVSYRSAGSGPVVVLVHGITSTSATWENVLPYLAERFTVIAPDLLGHGESAKPRGDYSLGAYASGIRDLLIALGHDRATFVGHSRRSLPHVLDRPSAQKRKPPLTGWLAARPSVDGRASR